MVMRGSARRVGVDRVAAEIALSAAGRESARRYRAATPTASTASTASTSATGPQRAVGGISR